MLEKSKKRNNKQKEINLSNIENTENPIQNTKTFPAPLTLELAPDKEGTKRNIQHKNALFRETNNLNRGKVRRKCYIKKSRGSLGNNTPWLSFEISPIHMQYNELY